MRSEGLLSAVVIGGGIVLAAVAFALVGDLLRGAKDSGPEAMLARVNRDLDAKEARIGALEQAVETLRRQIDGVNDRLATLAAPPVPVPAPPPVSPGLAPSPGNEDLIEGMLLAKGRFNKGIDRPTPATLRALLGEPRASYSDTCQPVTNPKLNALLETRKVGPIEVTMVRPALDSLGEIMDRLARDEPAVYAALGTAGALCARHVRGAPGTVSSHAWGMAIDLTLSGNLDRMGDRSTQFGLVVLAEFFNDAGWFWGAGYEREDSMHFEPGEALLDTWAAQGRL
ncbi:M15 family metallopeptidase [Amaricoccus solimangrovi]|uniref:M15 family metallopeptidase n=1 Tax=Amaricoccus solimangrovi TaxID=2589815 RepID=A0A501WIL7_9RHOB|nr:M15 family metallopeptidase [Amaricoccus solimangrovi]TPE48210.1 M15 family metallopeptidase [Amaricoccus solimangrovi]